MQSGVRCMGLQQNRKYKLISPLLEEFQRETHLSTNIRSGYADDGQNDERVEKGSPGEHHQSDVRTEVGKENVVQNIASTRNVGPVVEKEGCRFI